MDAPKKDIREIEKMLRAGPADGSPWRHYKGTIYWVECKAVSEATQEVLVIYRQPGTLACFARPLKEWEELVGPEGKQVPRFVPESFIPEA